MRRIAAGILVLALAAGCSRKDPALPHAVPAKVEQPRPPAPALSGKTIAELRAMLVRPDGASIVEITGALREAAKDRNPGVAAAAREALKSYPDPDEFPRAPERK